MSLDEVDVLGAEIVLRVELPVDIGELLADERKRRGLTQDDLAHLTRIESSNIRGYENGRALMGIPTLIRIADALKVAPSELLDGVTVEMFPTSASDGWRRG
ncbi:helix-turn-helix transcriptional regulator [Microbacterium sp. ARD32]|uniref:helix-turn-helix domain-containing protein n=1 Tax=Microbacterium sp. ARD32 TaxID=2962577 RepID=UPI002881B473|nr:helix-turn-helix transcriptional regulator [Microbacterium sp. ARD32]MDT0158806.1 helix-turn-helix transcriptional regulator [Microbacterium sp. ARD32]